MEENNRTRGERLTNTDLVTDQTIQDDELKASKWYPFPRKEFD